MATVAGRIRRRSSFRALARPEARAAHGPVRVAYSQVDEGFGAPLVGYAIGRQVGNAVTRNRVRRRLRASANAIAPTLPAGSYLVRVAREAAAMDYTTLDHAFRSAAAAAAARAGSARPAEAFG